MPPWPDRLGAPLADASFAMMNRALDRMRWLGIDIMHTARSFDVYRHMFYRNRPAARVLADLQGQRVVDVACGYTPYAPDSMFQACQAAGIEFYGVDPALSEALVPGLGDRLLSKWTGGSGEFLHRPPGMERALSATAQSLPFEDGSVDEILCGFLLWVWIDEDRVLADIFREMSRVLRPGGVARLFPLPQWHRLGATHPSLREALAGFELSQHFVLGKPRAKTLSAMLTTLVKL
jgi:ubiquinone/menaquinone biosynthesis C-methylase UbiE